MRTFLGLVCLILAPCWARAYSPQALADFAAGRRYEAAGRWGPAAYAYDAALRADPSLTVTYKALGMVYYMAGDRKSALYFYDRYLSSNPGDAATRDFAVRLRAALGTAPPVVPAQTSPALGTRNHGPFRPGFDVRLPMMGILAGASDVDEFYDNYSAPPAGRA